MTDQDNSYRPRSPDFSSFPGSYQQQQQQQQQALPDSHYNQIPYAPPVAQPVTPHASYEASPFFNPQLAQPSPTYISQPAFPLSFADMAPQTRSRTQQSLDLNPPPPQPPYLESHSQPFPEPEPAPEPEHHIAQSPGPSQGIEVKTKFPVARIKRIMQADEDVGKVAQVTPIAVSKALELFMISLVTKAAHQAKDRSSKRVTAAHLKDAIANDEVLDFLADIIAKVPEHAPSARKDDDGSDKNDGRKKKGAGRRKREDDSS